MRSNLAFTICFTALALTANITAAQITAAVDSAARLDHTPLSLAELARQLPRTQRPRPAYDTVPNVFRKPPLALDDPYHFDPLLKHAYNPVLSPRPGVSFPGPSSDENQQLFGIRISPPDINGDVSENFVAIYVNLVWSVYDKAGDLVAGPFPGNAFWAGFGGPCETTNDGDPVVIYDASAGRWVFTQFAPRSGTQCFAISDGEDPTAGFTRYAFIVEPNAFNDYPKVGVWVSADGEQSAYTYTGRNFIPQNDPDFARDITAVLFDRDRMLMGMPANFTTAVMPGGFQTYDGPQPGSVEAGFVAPAGACPLFSVADLLFDVYRFFRFCENFPGAGAFTTLPAVNVPAFDSSLGGVAQPGTSQRLDTLAFYTMYRANHAVVGATHQLAMAHTVDVGSDRAGMRWAILDVDDYDAISLIDTGTHAPPDGLERWMGSVALDRAGNLGLGFTRGGAGAFPSVFYTGRETSDPPGTVQQEVQCVEGTGAQLGVGRWGDYSATVLDPDGCTFWTFQEYVQTSGSFEWDTRACSFDFPSCARVPLPPAAVAVLAMLLLGCARRAYSPRCWREAQGRA